MLQFNLESGVGQQDRKSTEHKCEKEFIIVLKILKKKNKLIEDERARNHIQKKWNIKAFRMR